jgi:hypothetical protein
MHYHAGKIIIVTELDLIHRDGIVLVDDRNDTVIQKRLERVPRIKKSCPVREVFTREQHLRDFFPVRAEGLFIHPHETGLADGRRCLLE